MTELESNDELTGEFESPGGYVFGIQGWTWGEQKPTSVTFFLDGTSKVTDQHGRPIKGALIDNKAYYFEKCSHADTVYALKEERIDLIEHMNKAGTPCQRCKGEKRLLSGEMCRVCRATGLLQVVTVAGWPQLPYAQLKEIKNLPPTPIEELKKIKDATLRKDALRIKQEREEASLKEMMVEG